MAHDALLHDLFVEKNPTNMYMHFLHLANIMWRKYLNLFFIEGRDTLNHYI